MRRPLSTLLDTPVAWRFGPCGRAEDGRRREPPARPVGRSPSSAA